LHYFALYTMLWYLLDMLNVPEFLLPLLSATLFAGLLCVATIFQSLVGVFVAATLVSIWRAVAPPPPPQYEIHRRPSTRIQTMFEGRQVSYINEGKTLEEYTGDKYFQELNTALYLHETKEIPLRKTLFSLALNLSYHILHPYEELPGVVYRGVQFDDGLIQKYREMTRTSPVVYFYGFTSTSASIFTAEKFAQGRCILRIALHRGNDMIFFFFFFFCCQ